MVPGRDGIAALGLLALIGAAWLESGTIPGEAQLFPRLVLGLMALLALAMLLRATAHPPAEPFLRNPGALAVTLSLSVLYLGAVDLAGYLAATALFVPALALALGLRRPVLLVLTTAVFVAALHLVFVVAFNRPLPRGLFAD